MTNEEFMNFIVDKFNSFEKGLTTLKKDWMDLKKDLMKLLQK
ncbi:hypothetical protein [Thermoanaerobacter sp. RKWS2]|nr:hypothetical protein [Thermoanaerobacter sp. RKWS2]UZQ83654.1 hypothetical protein OEI98_000761 [Thermoanaerobacter sp. RKWS2]